VVLDLVRERQPPFSPGDVTAEFAALLKAYGIGTVRGDRYGGLWPRERFAVHGIEYLTADKPKSDIYRDLLPALNSGRVELLDHARLMAQLCGLERRTARGGRDSIDHAPGALGRGICEQGLRRGLRVKVPPATDDPGSEAAPGCAMGATSLIGRDGGRRRHSDKQIFGSPINGGLLDARCKQRARNSNFT
jgi:hypothetical protein